MICLNFAPALKRNRRALISISRVETINFAAIDSSWQADVTPERGCLRLARKGGIIFTVFSQSDICDARSLRTPGAFRRKGVEEEEGAVGAAEEAGGIEAPDGS